MNDGTGVIETKVHAGNGLDNLVRTMLIIKQVLLPVEFLVHEAFGLAEVSQRFLRELVFSLLRAHLFNFLNGDVWVVVRGEVK